MSIRWQLGHMHWPIPHRLHGGGVEHHLLGGRRPRKLDPAAPAKDLRGGA
jgi:hypothetical protein